MTEPQCVGTPVSWLRLERWTLGELPDDQARAIEAHLGECAACRACADECAEPTALPALDLSARPAPTTPATSNLAPDVSRNEPLTRDEPALATVVRPARWQRPRDVRAEGGAHRARWAVPVSLAVAAALALAFLRPSTPRDPERGVTRVAPSDLPTEALGASDAALHRDDPTLTLLRERDGSVMEDPSSFLLGDRFAVQLTCRPALEGQPRVAVFQAGEWSLPLADDAVRCGNRVRVPGAFRLTEAAPADVCVLWGDTAEKARTAADELDAPDALQEATCRRVEPVVPPNLR